MKSLMFEIKKALLEKNLSTSASTEMNSTSMKIEDTIKNEKLKAAPKSKKRKAKSDVEEEDIIAKSKKDLETNDSKEEIEDEKVKTPDESPSTINLSDASSFDKLIDILNQFRAAHSFTNEEVSNRLKDYFNSLEREEKEVLHVLVKGLVQITVLDVDGKDAYTPSKLMFKINKIGSASSEKRKSIEKKINLTNLPSKEKEDKYKDTEGGLPITTIGAGVNEAINNKKYLINIVKSNNI
jgi:hypothetical protein